MWLRVTFAAALAALLVNATACGERETPVDPQLFAGPGARALLDGLREGDVLEGAKVVRVSPPRDGTLLVELVRGDIHFSVGIVRKGASPPDHLPPIVTERYEIGVGHVLPPGAPVTIDELLPVAHAVEARVKRREASVAMPAGL